MRYSDLIKQTITNKNEIHWDYYNMCSFKMNLDNILHIDRSNTFIGQYFKNGGKELPLLLNPAEAYAFVNQYFVEGRKEDALSFDFKEKYSLPDKRAVHTVSGFFLGLLIEHCLNGMNTLAVESPNFFPFSYLWFLTFLYHDYGYCVAEKDNSPITIPEHAPIPGEFLIRNLSGMCHGEYSALHLMQRDLGINLSPFYSYPGLLNRMWNSRQKNEVSLEHALLRELTQRAYAVTGRPRLRFNTGAEIRGHQYTSSLTTRYYNYCINERVRADHGIVGGYLFYDRMVKNYLCAYMALMFEHNVPGPLGDFYYNGRHFCAEQLPVFSYVADCILSHNIWKQPERSRVIYEKYRLDALLNEQFKNITFQENSLLYILVIADSIEPTKVYSGLSPQQVADNIDIEYLPASRVLTLSSVIDEFSIEDLYRSAKELENWTSVHCSELAENKFSLYI